MAQQIDTIIVDLQVSNREAVAAIEQATERLAELKQEEAELNKERKNGEVTEEAYLKQLTAIREETERAKDSKNQYTKALRENVKQEKIYADSLNGLYIAESLTGSNSVANLGQIYENNITQSILSKVGNTDDGGVAFKLDPLVVLGILQFSRKIHGKYLR